MFKAHLKNNLANESIRYIGLWLGLLLLSGTIVSLAQESPTYIIIPFKIFVDLILFLIAFYVQKNFVFKTN